MKNTLILVGFLALAPFAKGQLLLEALEGGVSSSEKCLEQVKDKHYGDGEHNFIYCAVMGPNGKKWLNLNLGAEYAKEGSPHFNPEAQPTDYNDWKASGSLFQYGRKADGHELVTYEKGLSIWNVNRVHPVIYTTVNSVNSPKNYVSASNSYWANDIRSVTSGLSALWEGVNNPCPNGYRVMNVNDVQSFIKQNELVLEPNSHVNYKSMAILKNNQYPNLNLFTGVTFGETLYYSYGTAISSSSNRGTSAIWVLYAQNAPFGFKNDTGWTGTLNNVTHLDFGYFAGDVATQQLAFSSNSYVWPLGDDNDYIETPYNAVRCVEK